MYLYQRLCPSLLAQANFTISKIITDYKRGGDDVNSFLKLSPSLLSSTLCLLLEAPIDSLRSLIQVSTCTYMFVIVKHWQGCGQLQL